MHSSRMRTAYSSSRWGGGSASVHAGIHSPPVCGPGDPLGCGPGDPPECGPRDPTGYGLETPQVWAWRSPGCEPGDPPECGSGDPPGETPQLLPWVWAWKPGRHAGIPPPGDLLQGMLGYHMQCMLGYHPPPCTDRHV